MTDGRTTEFYDKWCSRGGKDPRRNRELRRKLLLDAKDSTALQSELKAMCRRDLLFYVNAFVYIFEPRKKQVLPFVTFPFQDETLLKLQNSIGKHDVLLEKSRDMGASWMCLTVIEHEFHFHENGTFAMYSYKEDLVDKTGDPDALFWKVDHIHKNQPGWMLPHIKRNALHIENLSLSSTIEGSGITENTTVGGRKAVILFDEAAKVSRGDVIFQNARDSTQTRWFTSTANGTGNKFYEIREQAHAQKVAFTQNPEEEPAIELITLHWTLHPHKNQGLYYTEDGKPRSLIYDREMKRCGNPREMAQEWDIDYAAAGHQFFGQESLELQRQQCRPPDLTGQLSYESESATPIEFMFADTGLFHLWTDNDFFLDEKGNPPSDRGYSIGADVSVGTGASNSALTVTDKSLNRKVAAYADPHMSEYEFARLAVAVCRWFKGDDAEGAYLIWERNGPGTSFGNEVLRLGYKNIYYQERDEKSVDKRYSDKPGWPPTLEGKRALLAELRRAEVAGEWTNQCLESNRERQHYVMLPNGSVNHASTVKAEDPTKAKANHGDRVIADALSWKGCAEVPHRKPAEIKEPYPVGSFGWRFERRQREQKEMEEEYAVF